MKVNFIKYKPFIDCKNPFLYIVKDRNSLPQVQKLNNFIDENRITDLAYYPTNTQHDLICVVLNEHYCNLEQLNEIIEILKPRPIYVQISDADLDKIISKYYIDFMLEKSNEMNIGFTNEERIKFRDNIKRILKDIVNKNIPKDFLIKG